MASLKVGENIFLVVKMLGWNLFTCLYLHTSRKFFKLSENFFFIMYSVLFYQIYYMYGDRRT